MNKYVIFIFFIIFFINSCSFSENIKETFLKIEKSSLLKKNPKSIVLNFDCTVENIILDILSSNNILISNNTLFFMNVLENKSDFFIDKEKLTDLIKNKITKNTKKIFFIDKKTIEKNKKTLGILNIKSSIDTNTAMLISRNNNAKYYLYSCISGINEPLSLKIKLILVKTGEIVFMRTMKFFW